MGSAVRTYRPSLEALEPRVLLTVFTAIKDNTLYEHPTGGTSNGEGPSLFAGMTQRPSSPLRRALVAFDLSSIPAGAVVTDARLDMLITKSPFGSLVDHDFALHRVLEDWGEGVSATVNEGGLGTAAATGDATWLHTSFSSAEWSSPGGDFVPTASATSTLENEGAMASWSSAGLIADVQHWVDQPADNLGWILRGEEGSPGTARRFSSREGETPPQLDVTFTVPGPTVTLSVDRAEISEDSDTATFTLTLAESSDVAVTVDLSLAGSADASDFSSTPTQVVIPAGQSTGSLSITSIPDAIDEPDETVVVAIASVVNGVEDGTQQQTITIVDDDAPIEPQVTLSIDQPSIPETGGQAVATVALSEATTVPVTVDIQLAGTATLDTDYQVTGSQIVIPAGLLSGILAVVAVPDELDEMDETVIIGIASVTNGTELGEQFATLTIEDDDEPTGLTVLSFLATPSGFQATFSQDLDAAELNLFEASAVGSNPSDVEFVGATTGPVAGSLVVDPSLRMVEFVRTGGPLLHDSYTLTLRSGVNGFKSFEGSALDGDNDGVEGGDYVQTFTSEAPDPTAVTISIPDFARGPGQEANLPATSAGLPILISNGANVRLVDMRISYDSTKLSLTGATVGMDAAEDATVSLNSVTPGLAIVTYVASTALDPGPQEVIRLEAAVPANAGSEIYGQQHLIEVHRVTVSDGGGVELPVIEDKAVHLTTFLGDASGNGRVNAADAAAVARLAALLASGVSASLLTDPRLVSDVTLNERINAADAARIAQFAALLPVDEIPPIPAGVLGAATVNDTDSLVTVASTNVHTGERAERNTNAELGLAESLDRLEVAAWDEVAIVNEEPWRDLVFEDLADAVIGDLLADDLVAIVAGTRRVVSA